MSVMSVYDLGYELAILTFFRDRGVLSPEEFATAKTSLLNDLRPTPLEPHTLDVARARVFVLFRPAPLEPTFDIVRARVRVDFRPTPLEPPGPDVSTVWLRADDRELQLSPPVPAASSSRTRGRPPSR